MLCYVTAAAREIKSTRMALLLFIPNTDTSTTLCCYTVTAAEIKTESVGIIIHSKQVTVAVFSSITIPTTRRINTFFSQCRLGTAEGYDELGIE